MRATTLFLIAITSIISVLYAQQNGTTPGENDGLDGVQTSIVLSHTQQDKDKTTYSLQFGAQFVLHGSLLFLPYDIKIGDKIMFTDMKGKRVLGYTHDVRLSKISIPQFSHSAYIVSLYRENQLIRSNSIMVGEQ